MAKSPVYRVDGTGRDSYVSHGNGGFSNPSTSHNFDSRVAFKQALRNYEPDVDYLKRRGIDQQALKPTRISVKQQKVPRRSRLLSMLTNSGDFKIKSARNSTHSLLMSTPRGNKNERDFSLASQ